ncbi:hypothetical protein E4U21_005213 [Claviceps maximensis]|nr:hypothetical protein E4U21_005213 [Claviceps maximensis]
MPGHYAIPTPADAGDVDLAIANLVLHAPLFPLACYIAWKHGKRGMNCWPPFVTSFILIFLSTGWKISYRDDDSRYDVVSKYTGGAIVNMLTFSLIGLVYEIGVLIPNVWGPRTNKLILLSFYIVMLAAIGTAFYGGETRQGTPDNMQPSKADEFGNCVLLVSLSALAAWVAWTYRRISTCKDDVEYRNARVMLFAAAVGVFFQAFRLLYETVFAFTMLPHLDPNTGSIVTRLVLVFFMEYAGAVTLCVGGWCSRDVGNPRPACQPAQSSSVPMVTGKE